ncbi:unnamed protein product [Angiostrongylus costaricensis]|uniref:Secreted protein n=1 Tax=Angiostrongylus costaricensis TaxID=334426 RepID=A0A0R3PPV7_ANGCS|nr:unnamed protein product [Angiostrongylus costaricensis]
MVIPAVVWSWFLAKVATGVMHSLNFSIACIRTNGHFSSSSLNRDNHRTICSVAMHL